MSKIIHHVRTLAIVLLAGTTLAACTGFRTPTFQGSPPLSAVPDKVKTFAAPYTDHIGLGAYGAAILLGPNLLPGRCEGLFMQGDRALVCDQIARYNGEPPAKPDPNGQYSCIRTLGGVTECAPRTASRQPEAVPVPSP
ncbi:MAG: hypothetical protein GC202_03035 [Alphaproteobacteria bacterium]|nr:hypothetical protein [Alphaproteobacteria bacterium]